MRHMFETVCGYCKEEKQSSSKNWKMLSTDSYISSTQTHLKNWIAKYKDATIFPFK